MSEPTAIPAGRSRARGWLPYLLIACAAAVAFASTVRFGLVYDDVVIRANPLMQAPARVLDTFTSPFYGPTRNDIDIYRPLTAWSFAWNWWLNEALGLAGDHAASFHIVNVLLHAGAACLLAVWVRALGLSSFLALAAGLLFAVLPIHSEAVANVYGRSEPLAVLLGLAYLVCLRRGHRILGSLAFLCAAWSKESALTFLPLAVAADLCFPREGRRFRTLDHAGALAASAVFLALRASALHGALDRPMILENPLATASALERVLTAARVQLDYLALCVWPMRLSTDYSYDQIPVVTSALHPRVLGFVALVLAALAAAVLARRRRPVVTLAVLAWAILFALTSNFVFPIGTIMGERLAYAPSIGFVLLAGAGFELLEARAGRNAAALVLALVVLAGAVVTARQNEAWKDPITLFRAQVASAPRSARAHANLGTALQQAGDDAGAIPQFEAAVRIYPQEVNSWYGLGIALYNLRAEPVLVISAFKRALQFGPAHHDARAKLAIVLAQCGHKDEARRVAEELARLAPGHPALAEIARLLATAPAPPR